MSQPIFEVHNLAVAVNDADAARRRSQEGVMIEPYGPTLPYGWVEAISDVSFSVRPGEVLAIVGESGSGKTLSVMGSLGLLGPGAKVARGRVLFDSIQIRPTRALEKKESQRRLRRRPRKRERFMEELLDDDWRHVMGTEVGVLFQNAIGGWNPVEIIGRQAGEALDEHTSMTLEEIETRVFDALGEVQLPKTSKFVAFPDELSRGQAQRAMLAAALVKGPRLLVADEPLTGLDAGVAAAIRKLIGDMQRKRKMAMIVVTHDLAQVASLADRIAIMYCGRIVERGLVADVFRRPQHPYTEGLLGALPRPGVRRLTPISGDAPKITDAPTDECSLIPRCRYADSQCEEGLPPLLPRAVGETACIKVDELQLDGTTAAN
ncbi:MAG: ABC transporter ATP-binding protein [Actinomycetota bacterium]|nr:ABC transporter ATP-binding protein [Actinomycetota bacterium]